MPIRTDMSIRDALKRDLIRLFSGRNPLNYIQDVRVIETPQDTRCEVTCLVPSLPDLYGNPDYISVTNPTDISKMLNDYFLSGLYPPKGQRIIPEHPNCKCSEKKIDPMDAVKWLTPERIIYSGPKTVVFWPDGTKTIVSLMDGDEHDEYGAFCAAIVKKMFGSTHKAKKFLNTIKVIPEPKVKKAKEEKPWEKMETMPMPGTEDPNWGEKHWGQAASVEEDSCNG